MVLRLLSYIVNISILFIINTVLTIKHLPFNLVKHWDSLELKEKGRFKVSARLKERVNVKIFSLFYFINIVCTYNQAIE
jgi:hypothetical protein